MSSPGGGEPEPPEDARPPASSSAGEVAPGGGEAGEPAPAADVPAGTRRVPAARGRPGGMPSPLGYGGRERRRGPAAHALRWIVVLVVALPLIAVAWFANALLQPFHGAGSGRVSVTIPHGAGANQIGDLLERRGVVDSGFFFSLRARLSGKRGQLRSGLFVLRRKMSYGGAIEALTTASGIGPTIHVAIPEGRSVSETVPIVKRAGLTGDYTAATRSSPYVDPRRYRAPAGTTTLEGFLFPATYELKPHAPVDRLVAQQVKAFKSAFASVDLRYARSKHLTPYDVLIIASMVEREATVARERPLIAAVIYNRLRKRIQLGIDATIRYALNNWTRPLRVSELETPSPYNTRKRLGLPPTPIGNPGLASIEAAAHPAHAPYLYYVVKVCGNGAHRFSSTNAQFQRDVTAYKVARAKRGGRDPSHCR